MTRARRVLIAALPCLLLVWGCGNQVVAEPITTTDIGTPDCQHLTVPVKTSQGKKDVRAATAKECLDIIDQVPANAALPDLVMKQLNGCGAGELEANDGDCFRIINPAPYVKAFPELEGRKLLAFPIITLNIGAGPSEIIADRTAKDSEDWKAYQTFYTAVGKRLGSVYAPDVEFYFAGDEHDHWHVRDFDDYQLLDADNQQLRVAEKHGYCLQDNTTYGPMEGQPGVPPDPGVYLEETSCGKGLPAALTIIHGLSRGWGDTYPSSLPDQAIDITGVPDGTYTIFVQADTQNAVVESNETNNGTLMQITIRGDQVTSHPSTQRGGIP